MRHRFLLYSKVFIDAIKMSMTFLFFLHFFCTSIAPRNQPQTREPRNALFSKALTVPKAETAKSAKL